MMTTPFQGLHARSIGLNQRYHLGGYNLPPPGRTPPPGAPADPYAGILAALPRPFTPGQITSQARSQISPLVAALAAQIQKQTAAATHAIGGYASDAAAKLAALDFQQPYTQGESGQAAVDAALRQALSGQGAQDAAGLQQRLAVINDPSVAAAAHAVGANADASGNTQLAQGSAALSNLIANAAAAGSFGEKLPGISRLAGLQGITGAQQQGQQALATGTQQLEGQLPGIVSGLQQESDQRAGARASALQNRLARQDALAATSATNASRVQTAEIAAQAKASAAQIAQGRSDRSYRLQFAKTFGYDPVSGTVLPGYTLDTKGRVVKATKTAAGRAPSRLTAKQIQDYRGTAATLAENAHQGFTTVDKSGTSTTHPAITYKQALLEMDKEGVPRPIAVQYLNRWYPGTVTVGGKADRPGYLGVTVQSPGERQ